jgi:cyanophycinase
VLGLFLGVALMGSVAGGAEREGVPQGHLVIIGGGLKSDDAEVFQRFLNLAGGPEKARIGVFPTASVSSAAANSMLETLKQYGLPPGAGELLDITVANAATATSDPAMIERIERCTGLFFAGGDQRRIGRAFVRADSSDTPALAALRAVYEGGGVVGGTSAGAACMGELMFSSRGAAMDSLDYGLGETAHHRGAVVVPGLGLFRAGPIDQHFSHRGRLARLARVLIERHIPSGFGIDEDTAIDVSGDGSFEVLGRGGVTVVDAARAEASDTPLGYTARGLRLSYLERGDRYDPRTRSFTIHPSKRAIEIKEQAEHDEIGLISDLGREKAVKRALTEGLVMSTLDRRAGLFVRYAGKQGHGYRFLFRKTEATQGLHGLVDGDDRFAVLNVALDIEPITATLEPPETMMPVDLDATPAREVIQALVFRGVMPTDADRTFRPSEPLSRSEFAAILARATGLGPWRARGVTVADVPPDSRNATDVAMVVGAGLMPLDSDGAFRPEQPINPDELVAALARAAATAAAEDSLTPPATSPLASPVGPAPPENEPAGGPLDPAAKGQGYASRADVAVAVGKFLGLPWAAEDEEN